MRSTPSALTAAGALALAAAAFARFGFSGHAFLVAFVCIVLVILAAIDIDQRRIPNAIVIPASIVVLIGQLLRSPSHAAGFFAYGVGAAGLLLILSLLYPAGLGMGDTKLALLLGLAVGSKVVLALAIGFAAAAVFGLVLIATGRAKPRKTAIPAAPFLGLATLALLLIQ